MCAYKDKLLIYQRKSGLSVHVHRVCDFQDRSNIPENILEKDATRSRKDKKRALSSPRSIVDVTVALTLFGTLGRDILQGPRANS